MRSLLASTLMVFTAAPFTFISPPAAEAARKFTLTEIEKSKSFIFVYFAFIKCNLAKTKISESDAEALLKKEISKDENADVLLDFLNDKRVNELNNFIVKYLYENTENCEVQEEKIVDNNIEVFQELAEIFREEKPLPSGIDWMNNKK